MWLPVGILIVGFALSVLWLALASAVHLAGRWSGRSTGWFTPGMKRAVTMTVACALCGLGIHFGMTRVEAFAQQMPAAALGLDVARPWYGGIALHTLADRAEQHTLSADAATAVTERLLDSRWWIDDTRRQAFDPARPPERWLTIQMEQARLSDDQLARWLNLVPPPLFLAGADTRESPSSINITAVFGREWQRIDRVPYRVHRLEIAEILINGASEPFSIEETPDSNAELGWYATRVEYRVLGLQAPPGSNPRCEIEIIYRLDLEPSAYRDIGPLSWSTTLLVN